MSRKITLLIGGLRGGGAEKVCVTLANGLAERGYKVELVVLSLNGAMRDKELSSKVNLINLGVVHARHSVLALWRYLRLAHPNTVLSFNRQISVVVGLLRKFTGLNFKLISRNIIFLSIAESSKKGLWHGFISKYLIKKFYALSDLIIAQSFAMKDDLITYLRLPEHRVLVIHNPVSQEVYDFALTHKLNDIKKKEYILCVGRLEEQKAFHYAINAFASIAHGYPEFRLKIVGKGSLEHQLKEQVNTLGVADRVDFEGYQTDMIPYYLHARTTLLTSLYEGFPNVLVESIALGTPVVAFDCPSGPSEIVQDSINGFLVPLEDEVKLKDAIIKTLDADWPYETVIETTEPFQLDVIMSKYIRAIE